MNRSMLCRSLALALLALMVLAVPVLADWNPGEGHKMHFPQLPDPNGLDVNFRTPLILADDWKCSKTGPVSEIHFWFSAKGDWLDLNQPLVDQIFNIHVSIHANIPAGVGGVPFSRPGQLLWQRDYAATDVQLREYATGVQAWYDPATGEVIANDHQRIYQCNITGINAPFYQKRDGIYWLDVSISSQQELGWKTADLNQYPPPYTGMHYEDDAVWQQQGPIPSWQPLTFPAGPFLGESMDLAFVINGEFAQFNHKMHFPQYPDPEGADILFNTPFVLADDWQCSQSGDVSDIHFWFSAFEDWLDPTQPLTSQIFTIHVSIHDDIPDPDGEGPLYSMPGALLWSRDYAVDQVRISRCVTPGQDWYEPEQQLYIFDNHYLLFRCDITNIQDPFIQEQDKIYWLDVWMDAEGPLGWKTANVDEYPAPYTGMHFQDDAVWALSGAAPMWQELRWPSVHPRAGQSIDLAFVITGPTGTPVRPELRESFRLEQNYPNPFNPNTTIRYELPASANVLLAVYDVTGKLVRVLDSGLRSKGLNQAEWDGRDDNGVRAASGVYFYRLQAGNLSETRKMVLMK